MKRLEIQVHLSHNVQNSFSMHLVFLTGFLNKDPEIWHQNKDFTAARNIVKKLKVIPDTAERGVSLTSRI